MNRIYTSIIIIISVILIDIYSHHVILREENALENTLTAVQTYSLDKDTENALSLAEELTEQWEKSRKKLALFVSDKTLDEISDSISKIVPLLESDSDEVSAEAEYVKRKLLRTHTRDLPDIHNIF